MYAHPLCQNTSSTPCLPLGNYLPALQVGVVLLPPQARATREKSGQGPGGPLRKRVGEKVSWRDPGVPPARGMGPSSLPTIAGCTRGAPEPREGPLPCLPSSGPRWPAGGTLPILPRGGGRARRVGGGLGDGSRASEPSSCSTASNSNHPDPSVNSNLLTLTAPDKGGLTDLNLHGGLAFSPSLPWSPYPSLQVAPHLAIRAKCQHPSLPEVPAGLPQSTLCAHLRWRQACGHLTGVFPGLG